MARIYKRRGRFVNDYVDVAGLLTAIALRGSKGSSGGPAWMPAFWTR